MALPSAASATAAKVAASHEREITTARGYDQVCKRGVNRSRPSGVTREHWRRQLSSYRRSAEVASRPNPIGILMESQPRSASAANPGRERMTYALNYQRVDNPIRSSRSHAVHGGLQAEPGVRVQGLDAVPRMASGDVEHRAGIVEPGQECQPRPLAEIGVEPHAPDARVAAIRDRKIELGWPTW